MGCPLCQILVFLELFFLFFEPIFVFFTSEELGLILKLIWHVDFQLVVFFYPFRALSSIGLEAAILE